MNRRRNWRRAVANRGLLALGTLLVAGAATAVAEASGGNSTTPPRARLRAVACHRALDPAQRRISVEAVMRPVTGTSAMAIRFELLQRRPGGGGFQPLRVGDLGTWIAPTSPPTLGQRPGDVWMVSKPVVDLPAPATYRFRVSFRWSDATGRALRATTVQTAPCFQPELRPDLRVDAVSISPVQGHPKQALYTARISNAGATAAGPFVIAFSPADGIGARTRTVDRLQAHRTRLEQFVGRACTPADAPLVVVDPSHSIDDLNPGDNSLQVPQSCPAAALQPAAAPPSQGA